MKLTSSLDIFDTVPPMRWELIHHALLTLDIFSYLEDNDGVPEC